MVELVEGKTHTVIKRDGRTEPFSPRKLRKVIAWACDGNKVMIKELMDSLNVRIHNNIHISKLFDEVINTAANKISVIVPQWDDVAKRLLLQKYYKIVWGIKRDEYPDYLDVIYKGLKYRVYNAELLKRFSDAELQELGDYIKPERDFKFTFGGLELFMQKYSARYTKTKFLELPQHTYMRVAIQLHYSDKNYMEAIKKKYDMLSNHQIAVATPIMLNALSEQFNATSCVLIQVDDDTESIMEAARSSALYSKYASGLGFDVSRIRSVGSSIGIDGVSSGVVPFIKQYESIISAFNQKSARAGSAAVYFPWWHYEVLELLMLKDAGGKDEDRARKLKYAIKWNKVLTDRIKANEDVYVFDPKDTPELLNTFGDEFVRWYNHYCEKGGIRKRKLNSRELAFLFTKMRSDTGNIYWFSTDNANKYNMGTDFIPQSNLCAEVLLPTKPLEVTKSTLYQQFGTDNVFESREVTGEIGICNLTSINIKAWMQMSDQEKKDFTYNLLVGFDNAIENAYYPVKAGETFNKRHRAIGVGITNYHNALASMGIKLTDAKALEITHEIMEDVLYYILDASTTLAAERGKYATYGGSKWAQGMFPFELYSLPEELNFPLKHDWEALRSKLLVNGVRFEYHLSIPPGATSSLVLNFTEGIEPIRSLKTIREGTYTLPFLAPDIIKNRPYYEFAWDIPTETIIKLAAVRQKFIDQGQSLNLYYKNPDSAYELLKDIFYAEELGLKSLYYMNSQKAELQEEACEGCAV